MTLDQLLHGTDGKGWGSDACCAFEDYVSDGLWDDADYVFERFGDVGVAVVGASAFLASSAGSLFDFDDDESWFAGESDVHAQPAWRWSETEAEAFA